jgi:hypothetical protein
MTNQDQAGSPADFAQSRSLRWADELLGDNDAEVNELYHEGWAVIIGINNYVRTRLMYYSETIRPTTKN